MLIKQTISKKELFIKMEQEKRAFELKLKAEYRPLFKELDTNTSSCYFTYDQLDLLITKVLDNHTTHEAYQEVKKEYSLTQSHIENAYKRKSIFFKDILESQLTHPTFQLLKKHNFRSQWWMRAYHKEAVSTGLARISRNIKVASRLEELKHLQKQNKKLVKLVKSLETKLQIEDKNWFLNVALPMHEDNYSVAEIAAKTGQNRNTINKRLKRHHQSFEDMSS